MPLRDDIFDQRSASAERMPLGELKTQLAGIGDPSLRAAQDFLWSMNKGAAVGGPWRPTLGDEVEYDVPHREGMVQGGKVHEIQTRDAIVQVGVGEFALVPCDKLRPLRTARRRENKRREIMGALVKASSVHETRALLPMGSGGMEFAATIEYPAGTSPDEDVVLSYVASRYPGARVVDGDTTHPGKLSLVLAFTDPKLAARALDVSRGAAVHSEDPALPPSSRQHPPSTEMLNGTTGPQVDPLSRDAEEHLARLGRLNSMELVASSRETDAQGVSVHFEMWRDGAPMFVRSGKLTHVLAADATPATGTLRVSMQGAVDLMLDGFELRAGPDKDQPFASELTMHQDERGANDTGSYVVKADQEFAQGGELADKKPGGTVTVISGPATEADGAHRETIGGPGLTVAEKHVAVDEEAKDYYKNYYGEYGEKLTEDVKKSAAHDRLSMIRRAWTEVRGAEPSAEETLWVLGALGGQRKQAKDPNPLDPDDSMPPSGNPADFGGAPPAPGPTPPAPPAPSAGPTPPAPPAKPAAGTTSPADQQLAKDLISAMHSDPKLQPRLEPWLTRELAKLPEGERAKFPPGSPQAWQVLLPRALTTMPPATKQQLQHDYTAADVGAAGAGARAKEWAGQKLKNLNQAVNPFAGPSTRQKMEYGRNVKDDAAAAAAANAPPPPAPAPAAPAPAAPAAAPATPDAGGGAAPGAVPAGAAAPAMAVGQIVTINGVKVRLNQKMIQALTDSAPPKEQEKIRKRRTSAAVHTADAATEAYPGRRPGAQGTLHFNATGFKRDGDYVVMTTVWDPEVAEGYGGADLVHLLKTFAVQRAGEKEYIDLGFIGKPVVVMLDADVGVAEIRFRSSNSIGIAPEYLERKDDAYHGQL